MTRGQTHEPPPGMDWEGESEHLSRAPAVRAFQAECVKLGKTLEAVRALHGDRLELLDTECTPDLTREGANVDVTLTFHLSRVNMDFCGTPTQRLAKLLAELATKLEVEGRNHAK